MIQVPLDKAVTALLYQGAVFYFPGLAANPEPHNYVLLNLKPNKTAKLWFALGTSKIGLVRTDLPPFIGPLASRVLGSLWCVKTARVWQTLPV